MANIDNETIPKKSPVKSLDVNKLGSRRKTSSTRPSRVKQDHISRTVGSSLGTDFFNKQRTKSEEEGAIENKMRQDKRKDENVVPLEDGKESGGLNQIRKRARDMKEKLNVKKRVGDKMNQKVFNPAKEGTAKLLKLAWLNIITSFGLTLIYINLHVFGRAVLSKKIFCELGEEWLPANSGIKISGLSFIERIVLIFVDLLVIFAALALVCILMSILMPALGFFGKVFMIFSGGAKEGITNMNAL